MSDEIIDQHKIATELSQRAIDRLIETAEKKFKEYWAKHRNRDVSAYTDYLVRRGVQANAVRNFIYDKQDATLLDIFVPTRVSDGRGEQQGSEFIRRLCTRTGDTGKRPAAAFAIIGHAGTGKYLFLKYTFFEIQKLDSKHIPILVEVRKFNRLKVSDLTVRIYEDMLSVGSNITLEQIDQGLRDGLFIVILDGIDELKPSIYEHYKSQIVDFAQK